MTFTHIGSRRSCMTFSVAWYLYIFVHKVCMYSNTLRWLSLPLHCIFISKKLLSCTRGALARAAPVPQILLPDFTITQSTPSGWRKVEDKGKDPNVTRLFLPTCRGWNVTWMYTYFSWYIDQAHLPRYISWNIHTIMAPDILFTCPALNPCSTCVLTNSNFKHHVFQLVPYSAYGNMDNPWWSDYLNDKWH